jgi:hypothetical protein
VWGDDDYGQRAVPSDLGTCSAIASGAYHSIAIQRDTDGDGQGDGTDRDDDNDRAPDTTDNCPLVMNPSQLDCNANGIGDACELFTDCNENSIPDSCDIAEGAALDCNVNEIPDSCDITNGALDEDQDGRLDVCEIAYGDWDLDGVVAANELAFLLSGWGTSSPLFGDFTGDSIINAADLSVLLSRWGPVP